MILYLGGSVTGMTVKLVVLYTHPDDPDAFDRHYLGTHMPLVAMIPGLQRTETARIAALCAFGSEEGKVAVADYQNIAPPGSRLFVAVPDD